MKNWRTFDKAQHPHREDQKPPAPIGAVKEFAEESEKKPLAGRRILVVEDDFLIGLEVARDLEDLGAGIIGPVGTVVAAKTAIRDKICDGALLDVNLGHETSLELGRDLLAAGIPVLFVTAYVDYTALFDRGLELTPRLGKPVSRSLLRRKATEIFTKRRFDA